MARLGFLVGLVGGLLAQLQDDFLDGDFTNNPPWSGTDAYWVVTTDKRLRSNGPSATGTLYLSTPNALMDNTEWRFWVHLAFSPSTQNFARVYLVADRPDLTDPNLAGYYLKLGGITGSLDSLELWYQSGGVHTQLAGGRAGRFGGSNNVLRVRVVRSASGLWEAFTDTLGNDNWEPEFAITDVSLTTTSYFGVYFQHTSTNRQNLYFDDFYIGPPIVDTLPPALVSVSVVDGQTLRVQYSEPVQAASAEDPAHYSISPGGVGVASASLVAPAEVELTLVGVLQRSQVYTFTAFGILDRAGNSGGGSQPFVWPDIPVAGDVVFSEIMADPDPPVGLAPYEYVELYNRSSKWFSTGGWQFCDGSTCATLPASLVPPGGYVLLVPSGATSAYPQGLALAAWPTLNNSSDSLTLLSAEGVVLERLVYFDSWYRSSLKKNGGWSLERMDLDDLCARDSNWVASENSLGGTPGLPNSVLGRWRDTLPPTLTFIEVEAPSVLRLYFSESVDTVLMQDPSRYQLSGGLGIGAVTFAAPDVIRLTSSAPFVTSQVYTLTVGAVDCRGNDTALSMRFAVPSAPSPFDVVINEIMADPEPPVGLPAFEYVELFNRSSHYLDLTGWQLIVNSSVVVLPRIALWPGEYLLLTTLEGAMAYYGWGRAVGLAGFPALSNTGATIQLMTGAGILIDQVRYQRSWYRDPTKDDGGWSLERLQPEAFCAESLGWRASIDPRGGTPAQVNSVYDPQLSLHAQVVSVTYLAPYSIWIRFSEALPESLLAQPWVYTFLPEISVLAYTPLDGGRAVELFLMEALMESQVYTIRLSGLYNCASEPIPPLEVSLWVPAVAEPGDIVINEILSYPQTGGARYIELYNASKKFFDLSQLALARGDSLKSLSVLPAFILLPGAYVCISTDTADVKVRYGPPLEARFCQALWLPAYDYDADVVQLIRLRDTLVLERVPYTKAYHFPDLRTRRGVALERLSPWRSGSDPLNWYSAASTVGYGTPGYPNSQREPSLAQRSGLYLEPRTFSPDNDGYDDWTTIIIPNDKPAQKARITVFYPNGQVIRQLSPGELLEVGENRFRWDGTADDGRRLPTGVYIIEVELTDQAGGQIQRHRLLCAIAERLD